MGADNAKDAAADPPEPVEPAADYQNSEDEKNEKPPQPEEDKGKGDKAPEAETEAARERQRGRRSERKLKPQPAPSARHCAWPVGKPAQRSEKLLRQRPIGGPGRWGGSVQLVQCQGRVPGLRGQGFGHGLGFAPGQELGLADVVEFGREQRRRRLAGQGQGMPKLRQEVLARVGPAPA